ncbi:Alpha-glucosidase [Dactylella cylindrospora]|nr:Alpha-glucosidase [Dactylella cylindrospora]
MGYDVSDYREIHEPYGTTQDMEDLIEGLHNRGMKVIMDLVVNHTSDQHAWFQESRKSKTSQLRDWYIWRPPRFDTEGNRQPPNNWASAFGGSAWEYDALTDEYYFHLFCPEQPDLNWENASVVAAVHDIMRFWLDKGVDGFRMDVINLISKAPGLPDAPVTIDSSIHQPAYVHYAYGPRLHEYLRGLRSVLDNYDAFAVGELPWVKKPEDVLKVVARSRKELNMVFQFDIVEIDVGPLGKFTNASWSLETLRSVVDKWQSFMIVNDGWNALYLENHDQPRSVSRFASDHPDFRPYSAKMLATFLAFQSGTLFIFQGQELGMANLPQTWDLSEFKDVETINYINELSEVSKAKESFFWDKAISEVRAKARDNARSPFQWDETANAGFSSTTPWMRINDDYTTCNAKMQLNDPQSIFNYWKTILHLRRTLADVFVYGDFQFLARDDENILAYLRSHVSGHRALVLCNFSSTTVRWKVPAEVDSLCVGENMLICNYAPALPLNSIDSGAAKEIQFLPFECLVFYDNYNA